LVSRIAVGALHSRTLGVGGFELFEGVALRPRIDAEPSSATASNQDTGTNTDPTPDAMSAHARIMRRAGLRRRLELVVNEVRLSALERKLALERHETGGLDPHAVRALGQSYRARIRADVL